MQKGGRLDIESGKNELVSFERMMPENSAAFQISQKYYACGGWTSHSWNKKIQRLFFSVDYCGRTVQLTPMKQSRYLLSLTGLHSQLLAIAGVGDSNSILKVCEKYLASQNKWIDLPPLNIPRYEPGSILLPSKRAFCFCGRGVGAV